MNSHESHRPSARRHGAALASVLWIAALVFGLVLWASAFRITAGEAAVVLRFGDPRRVVVEPGLHLKLPSPIDTLKRIDMRTHVLDPEPSEFLTAEQRNLEIDAFVAWRVADPRVFLTSLGDRAGADARIEQVLQSAVNDVITVSPLSDIVNVEEHERDLHTITGEIREIVAASCRANGYGVDVLYAGIERVTFHRDNRPAIERSMMEGRQRAEVEILVKGQEEAARINRESGLAANEIVATANAEAARIRGEGEAEAKRIEKEAYELNPELFELLARLDILETLLAGQTIVIAADDPLWEGLRVPVRPAKSQVAPNDDGSDQ